MTTSFSGTGVALVTPFREDLSLDLEGLGRLVNHVIDGGVDYLVVLGTTGESVTLSQSEKEQVKKTVIATNHGRSRRGRRPGRVRAAARRSLRQA